MYNLFRMQNIFLYELHCKREIESHDNIMEQYPNYPKMWWRNLSHKLYTKSKSITNCKTLAGS